MPPRGYPKEKWVEEVVVLPEWVPEWTGAKKAMCLLVLWEWKQGE